MVKNFLAKLKNRHVRALHRQRGQSIIIVTFAFLGILAMLGLALDLSLVYIEQVRVGRTSDAAALAAVVELPSEEEAMVRAIEYIELNGYSVRDPVSSDTDILVRGCVASNPMPSGRPGGANVYEGGRITNTATNISATDVFTGALYSRAARQPARAVFVIDTAAYQGDGTTNCNPGNQQFGSANKIRVRGRVDVGMSFMQFFGFGAVPVGDTAVAENVTSLDVMMVMDVSGSMELDTACTDCWRARPLAQLRDDQLFYPDNGDFNPIPFNPSHPDVPRDGSGEPIGQSIAESYLCTQAPNPYRPVAGVDTSPGGPYHYLVHEAELYSANSSNWTIESRGPGKGVWSVQRGTKNGDHGNQAGTIARQSSNVCNPGIFGDGLDCTLGNRFPSTICTSVDCSAYVQARTFTTYQGADYPFLNGASFNLDCFSGDGGTAATGQCWNGLYVNRGGPAPSGPNNIPVLEYDFTTDWDGPTYIWLRAQGGGKQAFRWGGYFPLRADCPTDADTRTCQENNWGYYDNVYWQVVEANGSPFVITENNATRALGANNRYDWRDNRAVYDKWAWVRLGSVNVPKNQQHTLKIYQGSSGYKIDKIVFTNNPNGSSGSPPVVLNQNSGKGPKLTDGSATREACNVCNPLYGYTVQSGDCSCWKDPWNKSQAAANCTSRPAGSEPYSTLNDDLYKGLQPIRGSQEAIKRLALKLDPRFDQMGFVAFEGGVVSSRSKLQCLRQKGSACYTGSDPIAAYIDVLKAIEAQVPLGGTNIAAGMDEALEELGVKTPTNGYRDSSCTTVNNDGKTCDRGGAARKVIILLTDGTPSASPNCTTAPDFVDMWDNPDYSPEDRDYECAMYYAYKAAANNVTVYTIGLGGLVETDILTAMATGVDPRGNGPAAEPVFNGKGKFYSAANPNLLDGIFDEILSNIYIRIVG